MHSKGSSGLGSLRSRAICLRSTLETTQQQAASLKTGDKYQVRKNYCVAPMPWSSIATWDDCYM